MIWMSTYLRVWWYFQTHRRAVKQFTMEITCTFNTSSFCTSVNCYISWNCWIRIFSKSTTISRNCLSALREEAAPVSNWFLNNVHNILGRSLIVFARFGWESAPPFLAVFTLFTWPLYGGLYALVCMMYLGMDIAGSEGHSLLSHLYSSN